MKFEDLRKECINRPSQALCQSCPCQKECEYLKNILSKTAPCNVIPVLKNYDLSTTNRIFVNDEGYKLD